MTRKLTPEQKRTIDALFAKYGGAVERSQLVHVARDPKNPLHELFPWNDREAAHKHRLRIAGWILLSYRNAHFKNIELEDDRSTVYPSAPSTFRVRPTPEDAVKYVQAAVVLQDAYMRGQVIADKIQVLRRAIHGMRALPELAPFADRLTRLVNAFRVPAAEVPQAKGRRTRAL